MFSEVPFEEEVSEEPSTTARRTLSSLESCKSHAVVHFHTPGMKEFSVVAGAVYEQHSTFDPRLLNGDSWISTECHCLKCEGLRAVQRIETLTRRREEGSAQPVLLLLDLDNFGFRQFQWCPPKVPKNCRITNRELFSNVLVWGFFGSCFTRYHKVWPTDELLLNLESELEKEAGHGSPHRSDSVWKTLCSEQRLLLTPCSGRNQGADGVMREVVQAFTSYDILVVTGDTELIGILKEERRRERKRHHTASESESALQSCAELRFVNVSHVGKKLVPVWHSIAEQMAVMRGSRH